MPAAFTRPPTARSLKNLQIRAKRIRPSRFALYSATRMTTYSYRDASKILRISSARLRSWERTGLLQPSAVHDGEAALDFRDLAYIKTVLGLLQCGIPLRRIRHNIALIREKMPDLESPLGSLRVWVEGSSRIVLRHGGGLIEPSGQHVIDFSAAPPTNEREIILLENFFDARDDAPETALDWFERGCLADSSAETYDEAIAAYQNAIRIDPNFADAHCNLGTVYYNQGRRKEARACYERATQLDPEHVEGHYNLGSLFEEENQNEAAIRCYKTCIRSDPMYAEAQLNMALLYEKMGMRRRAKEHWHRYVQLEPTGNWAEIARKHLDL